MSAGLAVQEALSAILSDEPGFSGVYDGPPARASFPYVTIDAGHETDWSHKSGPGREVLIAITVWDEQPARLAKLADLVESLVLDVRQVAGWGLVSNRLIRRRTVRDVAGPWAAAIDLRARLLAD